jgi:hypothetical protein
MSSPAARLLDRELITVIEGLAAEFPDTPIGTIVRTVRSAAPPARQCDVRALPTVVTAVEAAARQSLMPMSWYAA